MIIRGMKNKEFQNVFKKGQGFLGKFLRIKVAKNDLDETRLGFIVSLKISKKAVIRNKIKRRLREIVRITETKPGYDIVVAVKPEIVDKNYQEIKKELVNLLKNAKILILKDN